MTVRVRVRARAHRRRWPTPSREPHGEGFTASLRRCRAHQILEERLAAATDERVRRGLQADLDLVMVGSTGTVLRICEALIADREGRR